MKVVSLFSRTNSAKNWSAEDALRDALASVGEKDKVLVIALDDRNGAYNIRFTQAGMAASEMLALLEKLKHDILTKHMSS